MAELNTATEIAQVAISGAEYVPIREDATPGLLRLTLARFKSWLFSGAAWVATPPTVGQALVFDDVSGNFIPGDVAAAGGGGAGVPAKGVSLTRAADLAVAANATVTVPFTAEVIDENNFWAVETPTDIVISEAGWYSCVFDYGRNQTGPDQFEDVQFFVNNVLIASHRNWFPANYAGTRTTAPFIHKFAANDVLQVKLAAYGTAGTFNNIRFLATPTGGAKGDIGPAASEELIANIQVAVDGIIPPFDVTGFRSVRMVYNLKRAGADGDFTGCGFRFNGVAANYYSKNAYASGAGGMTADGQQVNVATGALILLPSVLASSPRLTASGEAIFTGLDGALNKGWIDRNISYRVSDGGVFQHQINGFWDNAAVVTSIALQTPIAAGSSIQVFGVRAAAAPNPTHAPGGPNSLELTPLPAFQNAWVNYNAATHDVLKVVKTGRVVSITGFIKGGANATVAFTLPVGWRPDKELLAAARTAGGLAYLSFRADGTVFIDGPDSITWTAIDAFFIVPEINAYNSVGGSGLIGSQTLDVETNTVTFDLIPGTFKKLELSLLTKTTVGGSVLKLRCNDDAAANYRYSVANMYGRTLVGGATDFHIGTLETFFFQAVEVSIPFYTATVNKSIMSNMVYDVSSDIFQIVSHGGWAGLVPITKLTLTCTAGNFAVGSQFNLFGR